MKKLVLRKRMIQRIRKHDFRLFFQIRGMFFINKMRMKILFVVAFFIAGVQALRANDWPIYKGNIYFTANNDEIIVKTNTLQWSFQAKDTVYNPIVSDDRIYFADREKILYCLDESNGALLWKIDLVAISRRMGRPSAVAGKIKYPVIKGRYLYISDATALYCLDKTSGKILWVRAGLNRSSRVAYLDDSIYADPVLFGNMIVYGTRKYFLARNSTNGNLLWYNPDITSFGGFPSYYSHAVFTQSKNMREGRFIVYKLAADNGQVIWSRDIQNSFQIFNPVIFHNRVYIASQKSLYSLALSDGSILWKKKYSELITSGPAFTDRKILFTLGNHEVVVVNPENGEITDRFECEKASSPSFVLVRDQLYLASIEKTNDVSYTRLSAYRFQHHTTPLWTWRSPYPGGPSQAIAHDGKIYIPAGHYLYAIGGIIGGKTHVPAETNITVIALKNVRKGDRFNVNNIYFEVNEAYLKKDSRTVLNGLVRQLKKYSRVKMEIRGHTDSTGDRAYNQLLSEKRAEAVREYLIKHGINPTRLKTSGYGEDQPLASNETEVGRALNRRTEFIILER